VSLEEKKKKPSMLGDMKKMEPCPKCGMKNLEGAKFCNNCGTRLQAAPKGDFEGLSSLYLVGALYSLLSVAFNTLIRADLLLFGSYLVAGIFGLYIAYALKAGGIKGWIKYISMVTVAAGLIGTSLLFLIGLGIKGVIGPGWVIFLVTGWKLWKGRHNL